MTLDWLIIGGGIHGVHIAARLVGEAGVPPARLGIVDPAERLLERWRTSTATIGMTHLRSPSVHNLDLEPMSLKRFAGKSRNRKRGLFAHPYGRPALSLFNAHCDRVVATFGLANLHLQDRVIACSVEEDSVAVQLSSGRVITTKNLLLAIGASEQPEWPDWAPRNEPRVHHVFDPAFDGWPSSSETIAVVGGGISAAQVALRLVDEGHDVHLVSRHAMRQQLFDSDPGWLGPKLMDGFNRERDVDRRRALIAAARNRGSVPPEVDITLRRAIDRRRLRWHRSHIEGLEMREDGIELRLGNQDVLEVQRVFLATGFASHRPGGAMIDTLIHSASLPCAQCGYPIVDSVLRWHSRVFVSGPLAELELGPTARNIAGARQAGDRLVHAVHMTAST